MEKSVKITLIIVAAALVLAGILVGIKVYLFLQGKPPNTINVNGLATIKANPDLVAIYFRAETNGSTAQEAKNKNAEIVNRAIESLINLGIPENKIQTLDFNIYPEYNWVDGRQELIGYKAVHSFKVELETENIDKAGIAIDAAANASILIDHIDFELSQEKQNEYKAYALEKASQDARTKAEAIASGLGKKLGKIISVSDVSFEYYPWPIYRSEIPNIKEAKLAVTNIRPSEKEITARVLVVFEIV